ncbi:MAG: LamG domain-containing protein [Kiritimatiellae bacterium]|nr:LamG domain-containing protein [Kiritimatiellia bacterium]
MGGSGGGAQTAVSFDALDNLTAMTITGWYKSDGAFAGLARLVDRAAPTVGAGEWSLYFDPTPGRLQLNLGGTTFFNTTGDYWQTNKWIFFAVRFVGSSSVNFFIGDTNTTASLLSSTGGPVPANLGDGTRKLTVGNRENLGRAFKGCIDDVRIYDEAISDTNIEAIRVEGIPEPGTIGLLSLSSVLLIARRHRWRER